MIISTEYDSITAAGRTLTASFDMNGKKATYTVTVQAPGKYIQYEYSDFAEACEQYDELWNQGCAA